MTGALGSPRANAMWDFSWIERRYPGGGYEDWPSVCGGLVHRGYDTVRIDAFPHLVSANPTGRFRLRPCWTEHDWGAPFEVEIEPGPDLLEFIEVASGVGLTVALSSWFREDVHDRRRSLNSPAAFTGAWIATLKLIDDAGLIEAIEYVDLANEFAIPLFSPFMYEGDALTFDDIESRTSPRIEQWMRQTLQSVREHFPGIPLCYSFATEFENWRQQDVSDMDFLELHIWMALPIVSDFYEEIGYDLSTSHNDHASYICLAKHAQEAYLKDPDKWNACLEDAIAQAAAWSEEADIPLVTTESWSVVNWKDGPGLDWSWIKDLNEVGIRSALATKRWASLATSNFCGPQFSGMWGDIEWHRKMTDLIHAGQGPVLASNFVSR